MDYLRKNFKPLAFIAFAAILLGTLCYFMPGGDMSYDECVEANYLQPPGEAVGCINPEWCIYQFDGNRFLWHKGPPYVAIPLDGAKLDRLIEIGEQWDE